MPVDLPAPIAGYFEADGRRDTDAVVALFVRTAVVTDEGQTWAGLDAIRTWREGPASKYEYTTEVFDIQQPGTDDFVLTGRLQGNFPGGTADLTWRFSLSEGRISRLIIG